MGAVLADFSSSQFRSITVSNRVGNLRLMFSTAPDGGFTSIVNSSFTRGASPADVIPHELTPVAEPGELALAVALSRFKVQTVISAFPLFSIRVSPSSSPGRETVQETSWQEDVLFPVRDDRDLLGGRVNVQIRAEVVGCVAGGKVDRFPRHRVREQECQLEERRG